MGLTSVKRAVTLAALALLWLLSAVALVGNAQAASTQVLGSWSDSCPECTPPSMYYRPSLAVAPDGAAIAAWSSEGYGETWAALRAPGGSWQAPVALGEGGAPRVAISPGGTAVVAWLGRSNMLLSVADARRGKFSSPHTFAPPGSAVSAVGIDRRGDIALAWIDFEGSDEEGGPLFAAYRAAGAESWPEPVVLADAGDPREAFASDLALALAPTGRATVLWSEREPFGRDLLESRTRGPGSGGRWSRPAQVGGPGLPEELMLATDDSGDLAASWREYGHERTTLYATGRASHGRWRKPQRVLSAQNIEDLGFFGNLVLSGGARATLAAGVYGTPPGAKVEVVTGEALRGRWRKPVVLGTGSDVVVAANEQGDAAVAWLRSTARATPGGAASERVTVALRTTNGRWRAPQRIASGPGQPVEPDVGLDASGTATAVWLDRGGLVEAAEVLRTG